MVLKRKRRNVGIYLIGICNNKETECKNTEYYRVYLNGPGTIFNAANSSQFKLVFQDQKIKMERKLVVTVWCDKYCDVPVSYMEERNEYVSIICKNIDGRLVDVITDEEYVFANFSDSNTYKQITYSKKEEVSRDFVCEYLKGLNNELLNGYFARVNELRLYVQNNYITPEEKARLRIEMEKKEAEAKEKHEQEQDDFISNFHKNFNNFNSGNKKK